MSIAVALDDLVAASEDYGWAYVITVRSDSTPHIVAATPTWTSDGARIDAGRSTLRNAAERPSVTLCFPPLDPGGYSLIVDGSAAVVDEAALMFTPTGAVLHRPAAGTDGGASAGSVTGCVSDCAPIPTAD